MTPRLRPDPTHLQPLPRIRLTTTNYPLTTTNSPSPPLRRTEVRLTASTLLLLKEQSQRWADRHLSTSGIRHRPAIASAYVEWLLRERQASLRGPRAYFSPTESERRRKYARAVAPWDSTEHHYDGPPRVPDSRLSLRRALLKQYPKEGDTATRRRALETLRYGFVAAVEDGDVVPAETISHSEVGRLSLYLPKHAERVAQGAS